MTTLMTGCGTMRVSAQDCWDDTIKWVNVGFFLQETLHRGFYNHEEELMS